MNAASEPTSTDYAGSCHCGAVRFVLRSQKTPEDFAVRSCQCDFCRSQSASCTSDPQGSLQIDLSGAVNRYRFGTKTAEFLVCGTCGLAPVVVSECDTGLLGVVRANLLEAPDPFVSRAQPIEFGDETPEERLARRSRGWTPATLGEV